MKRNSKHLVLLAGFVLAIVLMLQFREFSVPVAQSTRAPSSPSEAYSPPVAIPTQNNSSNSTADLFVFETSTPAPAPIPTDKPIPVSSLPPLPTFVVPDQFSIMRIIYVNHENPGYRSILVDGTGEIIFEPWGAERAEVYGQPGERRVAPGGHAILFTATDEMNVEKGSVWVTSPSGSDYKLLVSNQDRCAPHDAIWSPDGKQIAYMVLCSEPNSYSYANAQGQLWVMNADGSDPRKVSEGFALDDVDIAGGPLTVFRWQKKGYIIFATYSRQLWAINPSSGEAYQLLEGVEPIEGRSSLSPDGQFMLTNGLLTVEQIQQAGFTPLATNFVEAWSPDGGYYVTRGRKGLIVHNVIANETTVVAAEMDGDIRGISPGGRYIVYTTGEGLFLLDTLNPRTQLLVVETSQNNSPNIAFQAWLPAP